MLLDRTRGKKEVKTYPKESTIFARATEMCIRVLLDTARASFPWDSKGAVLAAITISLRIPTERKDSSMSYVIKNRSL